MLAAWGTGGKENWQVADAQGAHGSTIRKDCGVVGGALTWESGGLDLSLSSVEDLLGDPGSHLAFLWLSLLICQTRVPSGQPILPGASRHGHFQALRF